MFLRGCSFLSEDLCDPLRSLHSLCMSHCTDWMGRTLLLDLPIPSGKSSTDTAKSGADDLFIESTESTEFAKWIVKLLTDNEYARLQEFLMQNPQAGDVISGCGGLGKSAGKL